MSSDIAIKVESLSKCYHIYDKPRDRLMQMLTRGRKKYFREFWALKDVSLEIKRGETIGIVGRNGSGKSTLLQLICGTLNPTNGLIKTNGRVAALLELGAGFNPEFTGRENVYMAASLYGLTREMVDARFDKIASFADIGDFIEQPVKVYSSGMYVRLAFAVIAHVDADILVVDEALSVGDAVFTQKCMRFIRAFQEKGTLLFVSHDMSSVLNLCRKAIWLGNGKIQQIGNAKDVAEAYLQYTLQQVYGNDAVLTSMNDEGAPPAGIEPPAVVDYGASFAVADNFAAAKGWKSGAAEVLGVHLARLDGGPEGVFRGGERVSMTIRARAIQELDRPILGFLVRDRLGQDLFGENTLPFTELNPLPVPAGKEFVGTFNFRLPMLPNGEYLVMASVAEGDQHTNVQHHYLHDALLIMVSSSQVRWGLVGVPFEKVSMNLA
ncbi:ABC transporter ATP-binding protein [Paraburkholderia sediminicola]|uniref:ABC transporter ATP-binding protein n=1 Tax=Paraburkholderia sediminicola TaxID=458836 RepID=UPI0038BBA09A